MSAAAVRERSPGFEQVFPREGTKGTALDSYGLVIEARHLAARRSTLYCVVLTDEVHDAIQEALDQQPAIVEYSSKKGGPRTKDWTLVVDLAGIRVLARKKKPNRRLELGPTVRQFFRYAKPIEAELGNWLVCYRVGGPASSGPAHVLDHDCDP